MHCTYKYKYNASLIKKKEKEPAVFFSQGASAFYHNPLASATCSEVSGVFGCDASFLQHRLLQYSRS